MCLMHVYQEENKILDKMHRQKVAEVEKLTQTVHELEEAVLAGGAAANAVRDYQRKVQEMNVLCHRYLLCITAYIYCSCAGLILDMAFFGCLFSG